MDSADMQPNRPSSSGPPRPVRMPAPPGGSDSSAPFVGMHDPEFYAAVARELRAGAPVLHSVIHTHQRPEAKRMRNGRPSHLPPLEPAAPPEEPRTASAPAGTCDGPRGDLDAELERISNDLHLWKVQRLSRELAAKQGEDRKAEMEVLMEKRLSNRQAMEQDRALRRIETIVRAMEPKIARQVEENAAVLAAEEGGAVAFEVPPVSSVRLELKKHDAERAERLARRLRDESAFTNSWLVERDLQRKYEERASCEREHGLLASLLSVEEESERRCILVLCGVARVATGVLQDETVFRAKVEQREAELRSALLDRLVKAIESLLPKRCQEDDDDDDGDDDDDEVSDGASKAAKTPSVRCFDNTAVDERLPLPPPDAVTPTQDLRDELGFENLETPAGAPAAEEPEGPVERPAEDRRAESAEPTDPLPEAPAADADGVAAGAQGEAMPEAEEIVPTVHTVEEGTAEGAAPAADADEPAAPPAAVDLAEPAPVVAPTAEAEAEAEAEENGTSPATAEETV